jgi:hypothetical protein
MTSFIHLTIVHLGANQLRRKILMGAFFLMPKNKPNFSLIGVAVGFAPLFHIISA